MLYFIFFLLSLGQVGRISFFGQQVNIYIYDLFAAIFLLQLAWSYRTKPLADFFSKKRPIYFFLVWLLISFMFSFTYFNFFQNLVSIFYFLRLLFYFSLFVYLRFYWQDAKAKSFSKPFLIFSLLTIVFSILQYFLYPNLRNLYYLGWDPHLYRIFGLFFDTSVSSAIYGMITIYFLLNFKKLYWNRYLTFFLITVFSLLGVFTYSRGFFLSFLLTLTIYLAAKKRFKYIFLVISLFAVAIVLLPKPFGEGVNLKRTFTIESRIEDYKQATSIWSKNFLFGVGYNRLRYVRNELGFLSNKNLDQTHSGASFSSSYLIILATSGIIGLILFVSVLAYMASLSELSLYLTIFLGVFSFIDNIFLHPFVLFLYLVLCANTAKKLNPSRRLR